MTKKNVVTESGLQKMKEDLDFLINVKRKEAAENVGIARGFGDLSENSEYEEAKNEQAKIESQIADLEYQISNAEVIHDHEIRTNIVGMGISVKVSYVDDNMEVEYTIVNSREVDLSKNMISDQSPIGKALMGTKVGDTVTVEVPAGVITLRVLEIEKK